MEGPVEGDIVVQRVQTNRELWEIRRRGPAAKPAGRLVSDATTLEEAKSLACDAAERDRIWIEGDGGQFSPFECKAAGSLKTRTAP
jgi:hypothetical protein